MLVEMLRASHLLLIFVGIEGGARSLASEGVPLRVDVVLRDLALHGASGHVITAAVNHNVVLEVLQHSVGVTTAILVLLELGTALRVAGAALGVPDMTLAFDFI